MNINQIVFTSDPLNQSYFPLNSQVQNITVNISTWLMERKEFFNTALQFGEICLAIGFIIGMIGGYYYAKGKFKKG